MSTNGNGQMHTQVTAQDAARAALTFLVRADFRAHERGMFDVAEQLLKAIAEGSVSVVQANAPAESPQPQLDA